MKHLLTIAIILSSVPCWCQVDNFDILNKHVTLLKIKTISKFFKSDNHSINEKQFQCEFDVNGKLETLKEFQRGPLPESHLEMVESYKYDSTGQKEAAYIIAPDGSLAIDTFIYDDQKFLVRKIRMSNGKVVRTKNYSRGEIKAFPKMEYDNEGQIIKEFVTDGNYNIFIYDSARNKIEEIEYQADNKYTRTIFRDDYKGLLSGADVYLLYMSADVEPLKYYFEYEFYQ